MTLDDFAVYERMVGADGFNYIIIFEVPGRKVLCVKENDVAGGGDAVNIVLMEKPV